jgi:hypothetical protein
MNYSHPDEIMCFINSPKMSKNLSRQSRKTKDRKSKIKQKNQVEQHLVDKSPSETDPFIKQVVCIYI